MAFGTNRPFPLCNYEASFRKPNMALFAMCTPNQDLSWIAGANLSGGYTTITGTIDGVNAVFTLGSQPASGVDIRRNGSSQILGTMYTISGQTVTFQPPYIPRTGDYLLAWIY